MCVLCLRACARVCVCVCNIMEHYIILINDIYSNVQSVMYVCSKLVDIHDVPTSLHETTTISRSQTIFCHSKDIYTYTVGSTVLHTIYPHYIYSRYSTVLLHTIYPHYIDSTPHHIGSTPQHIPTSYIQVVHSIYPHHIH